VVVAVLAFAIVSAIVCEALRMLRVVRMVFAGHVEIEIRGRDPAFDDVPSFETPALDGNRAQRGLQSLGVGAGVEQRAEQHVAARAADHLEVGDHETACSRSRASA
jgi:hypothetical protein